jgi:hypothetical protein
MYSNLENHVPSLGNFSSGTSYWTSYLNGVLKACYQVLIGGNTGDMDITHALFHVRAIRAF